MDHSNKFTPDEPSFWRLCNDNSICHCDYRVCCYSHRERTIY